MSAHLSRVQLFAAPDAAEEIARLITAIIEVAPTVRTMTRVDQVESLRYDFVSGGIGLEVMADDRTRVPSVLQFDTDHDFEYLVGSGGVFNHLTEQLIPEAGICDGGTAGWETDAGVIDLAPDAVWEHAPLGLCPGDVCRGWTPAHTVLLHRGGDTTR